MSSTALKTLAVVLVIAAAILGFVAFQFSQGLTQPQETTEQRAPQPGEDQVLAVVAVQRVPAYEPITKESVALVPVSVEPPQYYTDVSEVVGRTPLRAISVGTPVTDQAFGSANTLAQAIPSGAQAMSLEISDVIAVGGFVKPGDMVDVLIYLRSSGQEVENTQSRVLLKEARVLAYEERLINADTDGGDSEDGRQTRRQRTAVLAVPRDDTTRVMLGASLGDLRLSLRGSRGAEPVRVADSGQGGDSAAADGEPAPEALSPEAMEADAQGESDTGDEEAGGNGDADEEKSRKEKEKVVTLEELSEIEEDQEDDDDSGTPRRRPPGAVIEVYQGSQSSSIRRPY